MFNVHSKQLMLLALACLLPSIAFLQISDPSFGQPYSFQNSNLTSRTAVPKESTPQIDLPTIEQEDLANDPTRTAPTRFGIEQSVNYKLDNTGLWENLPNGDRLWRLRIEAPKALSINLVYEDFHIPDGARLHIYNETGEQVIGAFTSFNNKADSRFGTALVYGDVTILEYYEPANVQGQGRININTVVHGYRFIKDNAQLGNSGNCNIDTDCADGNPWRDEIKAAAKIILGGGLCSGSLLGNTNRDCTPYFLTANHCGFSSSTVFYWRFERPNCGSGTPDDTKTTTGAIMRAKSIGRSVIQSDFAIWELTESPVDAGYDVYYLGWDARDITPAAVVGIHHPAGDAKKISYENNTLTTTDYLANAVDPTQTHWRVIDWDSGTTEGGSSGSPIMDQTTKRVVGDLSGGGAACGNNSSDWYGKLSYSWANNGAISAASRANYWLDNAKTGELFIDGYAPGGCTPLSSTDGIRNQDETGVDCGGASSPPCPCETMATLSITFDNYPEETYWTVEGGGEAIASGGLYDAGIADGQTISIPMCIDLDCYTITVLDAWGDGICCGEGNGSYTLTSDEDGSVLATGGAIGTDQTDNFCIDGVSLTPKVNLQGPHNGADMNTDLGGAMIPTTSPYGDGATTTAAVINTYDIVDWVEVQLRNTTSPHAILAKRGALLKKDGTVVHTDGVTAVTFPKAVYSAIDDGNYRVAIQHRNHLGVMTNTNYTLD